jgi:putative redox protein
MKIFYIRYEYLLSALGSCTTITCRVYAKHRKLPLDKIIVDVSYRRILPLDPEWQQGLREIFTREIEFLGDDLTPEQIQKLTIIADKCPVHHLFTSDHCQVITKIKKR